MVELASTKIGAYTMLSGNDSAAYAVKLCRVEVVSAFPVEPATEILEKITDFVYSDEMKASLIPAESDFSALANISGAASAGSRVFTATSRQGLVYMQELIHWVGRGMLPMVMAVVDAAIGPPGHAGTEQDASLYQRDAGWLQFYCETSQEVFDTIIQAYRIAEKVSLPVMVCLDGFYLSHTSEPVCVPDIELVDQYLPSRKARVRVTPEEPMRLFGSTMSQEFDAMLRRRTQEAMETAEEFRRKTDKEFESIFRRSYSTVEGYRIEDAEVILVAMSSIASCARIVIDSMRKAGKKVGLLRIRMFRPFPSCEIIEALKNAKKVAVIDRNLSYGHGGMTCIEIKAAMCNEEKRPLIFGFVAGICGLPVIPELITSIVNYTYQREEPEGEIIWMGIKGNDKIK